MAETVASLPLISLTPERLLFTDPKSPHPTRAVFLDRDGVINVQPAEHDYVKNWSEFQFIHGASRLVRVINQAGYLVVVVTNQAGVARGLLTLEQCLEINQRMAVNLARKKARIDAIYCCPHNYDECDCRKPKPGMIQQAITDYGLRPEQCLFVDDTRTALMAGETAGCGRNILLVPGADLSPLPIRYVEKKGQAYYQHAKINL